MLHLQSCTPLILLSVNFGLHGKNLVTSTILISIKGLKMEEMYNVRHKNLQKIFGIEQLSSVQKSSFVKSKSKTSNVKPDNFMELFRIIKIC